MKKTCVITLLAAALLWMLPSCKPTEDPNHLSDQVVVTTADATFISAHFATCGAEVTAENFGLLTEIGVCWSKSANPTVDDFFGKSYKCSKPYSCLLTNLESNTEYHVRGFVKYGTEYYYGNEKTFTTLDNDNPGASPVTTLPAYDITYNGFTCGIAVEPFGVTTWYTGVCYSQYPECSLANCEGFECAIPEPVNGVYQVTCHGLMPNTEYYYRAFLRYRDEYSGENIYFYGEILSFTTPVRPFELQLYTYSPYYYSWNNSVDIYGEYYCSHPQVISQVGFCYSTEHEYPQYDSDFYTIAATPTGDMYYEFGSQINNLSANTKYYFRAYVLYMTDSIKYGNVESINTY